MPSFSRHNVCYCSSLITGPSSALLRLRFSDDHDGSMRVFLLAPDEHFGNAPEADVVATVNEAVREANEACGSDYRVAEIHYQTDNDRECRPIGRAAYSIVKRLEDVGEDAFSGVV